MKVGLVIGTYAALPYIHLQLESIRRLHPELTVLVLDDASPQRERLGELCQRYGAEFRSNTERLGHTRGDMKVFLEGLSWAKQRELDVLVKFSRRWIPLSPWLGELKDLICKTGAPTLSNRCAKHSFGFRSECVAMAVDAWKDSAAEAKLRQEDVPGKVLFMEAIAHHAAASIFPDAPEKCRAYVRAHPQKSRCGHYIAWPWMQESRTAHRADVLWHEWARPHEYERALIQWGVSDYKSADFYDAVANIR